jgi:hypothetical protein
VKSEPGFSLFTYNFSLFTFPFHSIPVGFDKNSTRLFLYFRQQGVDFTKTLTIGRQGLHVSVRALKENLREFGYPAGEARTILESSGGFAEPFLRLLGAQTTDSLDASPYEGANLVHDMNVPLRGELEGGYSCVIDGGSLEHVFNFPVAIKNAMELVREGGWYIAISPCNNYVGHGFYQFSPELYYRVFSPENGFEVQSMVFFTDAPRAHWYEVKDPMEVRSRVTLSNAFSSYLFVVARRTAVRPIFETTPQQSDYQFINWQEGISESHRHVERRAAAEAGTWVPGPVRQAILHLKYAYKSLKPVFRATGSANPDFFTRNR